MATDSPLSRDVLLFSTADWDHPFWTNKQHVASHLADRGFRVLYLESLGLRRPQASSRDLSRIVRRLRRAGARPRQARENLWVASPLAIPWHDRPLAAWLNHRLLARTIARQMRQLEFQAPIIWTYNPLVGRLAAELGASLLVYHAVDDLAAAPHMPSAAIEQAEQSLCRAADVVFSTSSALQTRLSPWNAATHLLPNVADYDHFSKARAPGRTPADLETIPHPRIGFVGALSPYKVDFQRIADAALARPGWQWVLIGQVGEGQPDASIELLRLPNVHLLGPRPYAELPDYLRGFDVATIPACANPYTAAMFPMKFFEYLAAGLPVVASNTPALADYANVCELADSTQDFITAIDRILAGSRPDAAICQQLAARHTWSWRIEEMLRIVEQAWRTRHAARSG